jgi:glycosyltransferase involved in cell wall biosynthesis
MFIPPSPARHRPHAVCPQLHTARVILTVKSYSNTPGISHAGLATTATNNIKVLREAGIYAEAWAVQNADELRARLAREIELTLKHGKTPITHIIVSSPSWCQPADFRRFTAENSDIDWVMLNHSGAAFLSIDKFGIRNNRELIELSLSVHNMRVAANNIRVADSLQRMFNVAPPILYLPNLYDTSSFVDPVAPREVIRPGGTLRIGGFGAARPWKNQLCAAQAAVIIAQQLGVSLEFYVNSKRPDGGERMIESRQELFSGLRGCKLIEVPWEPWPRFRQTVRCMHLQIHPSFDETFAVVVADGIAMGVPAVVSSACEWTPSSWWSNTPDPSDMARVGFYLLADSHAIEDARRNLRDYVALGLDRWSDYLVRHATQQARVS